MMMFLVLGGLLLLALVCCGLAVRARFKKAPAEPPIAPPAPGTLPQRLCSAPFLLCVILVVSSFSSYLSLFTTVPKVSLGFFASLCLLLGPVVLAAALLLKKPSPQLAGAAMLLLAAGYLCQTGAVISNLFASEAEDWEITLYYTTPVLLDLFCAAALFFSALRMFTSKGRGARWTVLLAFGIVLVIWLGSALFSGVNMGLAPSTFSSPLLFLGLALFTPPFFTGKGTRWGLLPFTTGGVLIVVAALVLAFALNGTVSFSGGGGSDSGGSGSTCPVCGRTYTDSSNKNSIWWSNMCNSCKHDYEAVEDALGGDLGAIFG